MKFTLTNDDRKRISKAAAKAESATSGEIASALIPESSDYIQYELAVTLTAGFLVFITAMFGYHAIDRIMRSLFWTFRDWYTAGSIGLVTVLAMGIVYLLTNIPAIDRLIIPSAEMEKRVYRRALTQFMESGVYKTRDRTGILIFVSLLERRVFLLADEGINEAVEQETWDRIITDLTGSIKDNDFVNGLEKAILSCGEVLTEHFPIKPDDTNELPDGIVVLEN